jgi:hypothetical protein
MASWSSEGDSGGGGWGILPHGLQPVDEECKAKVAAEKVRIHEI